MLDEQQRRFYTACFRIYRANTASLLYYQAANSRVDSLPSPFNFVAGGSDLLAVLALFRSRQ